MVYKLFIVRESRVLLALLVVSSNFLLSIYFTTLIESLFLKILGPILWFSFITIFSVYYTFSRLYVKVQDATLEFHWARKLLFQFSSVPKIDIKDIQYIVIDREANTNLQFLRTIKTSNTKIALGISKFKRYDADEFINFLKESSGAPILDSWDLWKQYGLLEGAYWVTTIIIFSIPIIIIYLLMAKGSPRVPVQSWLYLSGSYFLLLPFWFTIRSKR